MDLAYALFPPLTWLVAGSTKFAINSMKARSLAFDQIGYGSLPSNHSAIVGGTAALVAFREGIGHPAFGVAVALTFIVALDANSLRRHVGHQAAVLNELHRTQGVEALRPLRERMGHTRLEIVSGWVVGALVAWAMHAVAASM